MIDIGVTPGWPSNELTNFAPHGFWFDEVWCASMEGLLQAFKYEDVEKQKQVCLLVGKAAKFKGKKRNKVWKRLQKLWWQGKEFDRHSNEFQQLLDRAFAAMAEQCHNFRLALLATGQAVLEHSIGSSDPNNTVLTEVEFCSRLTVMRTRIFFSSF